MSCIKTGFHAELVCYDEWLYGDAFQVGEAWVFRVCARSSDRLREVKHFTIYDYDHWFDDRMTSVEWNSTLVAAPRRVTYHDYEGIILV